MDANVPWANTHGLRQRGVVVLTAQEDGTGRLPDPDLLDRATALGSVLFTQDADFLVEAARRQGAGEPFAGVVFAHQQGPSVGQCIDDLELIAKVNEPADMANTVQYLPL
jgi:hypothetical protein